MNKSKKAGIEKRQRGWNGIAPSPTRVLTPFSTRSEGHSSHGRRGYACGGRRALKGKNYNPVIGYLIIDKYNQVMGPPGEIKDVTYQSEARAKAAAVEYGYEAEVGQIAALHLGGVLSVVWGDVGDIYLDGPAAAAALVKACQKRR